MAATTIHLPAPLLEAIDARARAERVSRNRLITLAVERFLRDRESWSPDFLAELRKRPRPEDAAAIDELVRTVRTRRSSKRLPDL